MELIKWTKEIFCIEGDCVLFVEIVEEDMILEKL
jgi:hypothetical protein